MKATAKDLRTRTRQLLDAVDRGENVLITHRGTPRAKLVPIRSRPRRPAVQMPGFGMWKNNPRVQNVEEFIDTLRRGRFQ